MSLNNSGSAADDFNQAMREVIRADESELSAARSNHTKNHDLDLASFAMDYALERAQGKLDRMRWATPADDSPVPKAMLDLVFDSYFPQHVFIHPEAIKDINIKEMPPKTPLDNLCQGIFDAVAARLPRRVEAHIFSSEKAIETLHVPGLGDLRIEISSNANAFISIREIKGDFFILRNGRCSGRQYLGNYNDVSRIDTIKVSPLDLEVNLYDDHSPHVAVYKGITYQGHGNVLQFSQDSLNLSGDPEVRAAIAGKDTWEIRWGEFGKSIIETLKRPANINWAESLANLTSWLKENVEKPLLAMPECADQIATVERKPYLDQYPTLYTWVTPKRLEPMIVSENDASRLRPDEREIIKPAWRLVPWGEGENIPELAHCGFIWCGIGEPAPNTAAENYEIRGLTRDNDSSDYRNVLVRIRPNNAEGIYVVDYGPFDAMRHAFFEHTDTLSDDQYNQALTALTDTLVAIDQYKGGYQNPVVLSNRGFEMSEISIVEGVKYDPRPDIGHF